MKKLKKRFKQNQAIIALCCIVILTGMAFTTKGPMMVKNENILRASEVVERIKEHVTCNWSNETVDTFKEGNPEQQVTGIVVTFMATMEVLQQAVDKGCNLIITHEPTYYNHWDNQENFGKDKVIDAKRDFIKANNLLIFRFHDHWHRTNPDGIMKGMIDYFNWHENHVEGTYNQFKFEEQPLQAFVENLTKQHPEINPRVVGDPKMTFTNMAYAAGAPSSAAHINLLQQPGVEVLIAGEANEWETPEYVRDAQAQGKNKAVVFIGHAFSEEAGMAYCQKWLSSFIDEVPVLFIPAGTPFWQID